MVALNATIQQLWPDEAKKKMIEKKVSRKELKSLFTKVVFPWNPTYSSYRFFFQLEISELPLFVIVFPPNEKKTSKESVALLDYIAKKNLTLRVINGRHSSAVQNPDVYADISAMNKCNVIDDNTGRQLISVQAGATQGQVYDYLFSRQHTHHFAGGKLTHPLLSLALHPRANELAFPGGSASSVSVPGITGCGGIGTLKRTFGLTVDSVLGFKLAAFLPVKREVTSIESKIVKVGEEDLFKISPKNNKTCETKFNKNHETKSNKTRILAKPKSKTKSKTKSDLFWALRGGQVANFGIVLKSIYVLHPIKTTIRYVVSFEWTPEKAKQVLKLWQSTAPNRPNEFNEDLSLFSSALATDRKVEKKETKEKKLTQEFGISVGGVYVVDNANGLKDDGKEKVIVKKINEELKSLIALGGATVKIMVEDYAKTMTTLTNARVYRPFSSAKLVFSRKKVDPDFIIDKLIEAAELPGLHLFGIELMGGKISEVKSSETAFFPRQSKFMYDIFSYWDSALDTCRVSDWVSSVFNRVYQPTKNDHVYVGFPINNLPNHLDAYYGENKSRLQQIKMDVDPNSVLHFPTGIVE
jgi:FAD/FMN-containing dehydrogenase